MTESPLGKGIQFDLREARQDDYTFAENLYLATMKPLLVQLGAWNEEEVVAKFKQLFRLEEVRIVRVYGEDAGWFQTSESETEIRLTQIVLKEAYRSAGIGTTIIGNLLRKARAENRAVLLSVVRNNPALKLYKRLGFEIVSEGDYRIRMQWPPA